MPSLAAASLDALDLDRASPGAGTRKRTQRAARLLHGPKLLVGDRLAERGGESAARSGRRRAPPRTAPRRGRRRAAPPARPRARRARRRPPACRSAPPRRRPPAAASRAASTAAPTSAGASALGQTWASATPNAGGSATTRSVTVSGVNRPADARTRSPSPRGPGTSSSTSTTLDRDSPSASVERRRELLLGAHEHEPLLALAVGRLDDARVAERGRRGAASSSEAQTTWRGWGTPASANRSRWRSFEVASTAVAGPIGCGSAWRSAIRAAIATGQSMPGAIRPSTRSAAASRSIAARPRPR